MATYIEQSLTSLKSFEGSVPWMYLDTVGKVTVAVGRMLPDSNAACALGFQLEGRPATAAEIIADFERVHALSPAHTPAFYRVPGGLELPPAEIDALLFNTLTAFEQQIRTRLPTWDTLPDPAKIALLDMAYNLGVGGLFHEYPHLIAAIESRQWQLAAAQSLRHGISDARNAWTRSQFLTASSLKTIQAAAEPKDSLLAQFLYGAIGWFAKQLGR